MNEVLSSFSHAFDANRASAAKESLVFVLALLGVVLGLVLAGLISRARTRREALQELVERHGLDEGAEAWVTRAAKHAGVTVEELLTRVELFEQLSAVALTQPVDDDEPDVAPVIHRVRLALGFDRLPTWHPVHTTRELSAGTAVDLDGAHGEIFDVDERTFHVELRGGVAPPTLGSLVTLTLTHAREARYTARCVVLAADSHPRAAPGSTTLRLGHDERPSRVQRRAHVRVPVSGPVVLTLRRVGRWRTLPAELAGELGDVSVGGLRVLAPQWLPTGLTLSAVFKLAGEQFHSSRAVVTGCEPAPGGQATVHLKCSDLQESRFEAALVRLQEAQLAARDGPAQ
jgi:hypothetical protein